MSINQERDEQDYLEGERGPASVLVRKSKAGKLIAFAIITLIALAGATFAYVALIKNHRTPEKVKSDIIVNEAAVPPKNFLTAPTQPPPPAVAGDQIKIEASASAKKDNTPDPEDVLFAKRLSSPIVTSKDVQTHTPSPSSPPAAGTGMTFPHIKLPGEEAKRPPNLTDNLSPTDTPARPAGIIKNRNLTLAKGAFIDCVLETRIDSTVPGMTSCVVTRDIFSDNGKILLVERGSKMTGEYQSGVQQGQARIFVLWNRIKTVHGVTVNLDSPGTDPLGGSGLPGHVNNHFMKRFGAAILLSVIDDAFATAANLTRSAYDQNQTIVYNNTSSNANQMATEALKNSINIPPTLYKNHGERINIFVARDLSFEGVYHVAVDQR